jgi:putative radical SAM enzyme (TIGR03279 family)
MSRPGIKILEVAKGSLGHRLGLAPGDEILEIQGRPIPDELALKFYLSDDFVKIRVRKRGGGEALLSADLSKTRGLGIKVDEFRTRCCNNSCVFCFVDQLPPGARAGLRVKDDDFRLSFLHGNYITLTNLNETELDRIIEHRLSPLYVSIHATEPELRRQILGRRKSDDLELKLKRLVGGGIQINAQVVLVPGLNDGKNLERTLLDLSNYHPGVVSVAIVPLGLSDHGNPKDRLTPVSASYSRELIAQIAPMQRQFRTKVKCAFAYLADEFYIQAGVPLPTAGHYDGYLQIEDGVGMARRFLDEFASELGRRHKIRSHLNGTLVTASLFYPFLKECVDRFNHKLKARLSVIRADNHYLGKRITVAGLLSGQDFLASLQGISLGDFVVIPNEAISQVERIFLDDMSSEELSGNLMKPVYPSGRTMHEFFDLLCKRL